MVGSVIVQIWEVAFLEPGSFQHGRQPQPTDLRCPPEAPILGHHHGAYTITLYKRLAPSPSVAHLPASMSTTHGDPVHGAQLNSDTKLLTSPPGGTTQKPPDYGSTGNPTGVPVVAPPASSGAGDSSHHDPEIVGPTSDPSIGNTRPTPYKKGANGTATCHFCRIITIDRVRQEATEKRSITSHQSSDN